MSYASLAYGDAAMDAIEAGRGVVPILVDAAGSGTPGSPNTYGQFVQEIYGQIAGDPILSKYMSPIASMASQIARKTFDAIISGENVGDAIGGIAWVLADLVVSLIKDVVKDLLNIIPVLGAIVNLIIDLVYAAAKGAAASAEAEAQQRQIDCMTKIVLPKSGAEGVLVPADLFAPKSGDGTQYPSLGIYLMAITEPDPSDIAAVKFFQTLGGKKWPGIAFAARCQGHRKTKSPKDVLTGSGPRIEANLKIAKRVTDGKLLVPEIVSLTCVKGDFSRTEKPIYKVPLETRQLFTKMRKAMASQYIKGNGGREVWPVYLDTIIAQFDLGNINWSAASILCSRHNSCFEDNSSTWNGLVSQLASWRVKTHPVYGDEKQQLAEEIKKFNANVDASVKRVVAKRVGVAGKLEVKKLTKVVKRLTPTRTSPLLAMAIGGAAAGAGVYFALR